MDQNLADVDVGCLSDERLYDEEVEEDDEVVVTAYKTALADARESQ